MRSFAIVVAACSNGRGIGANGGLPWHLPRDLAHFQRLTSTVVDPRTTRNAVIMGRRTWESIPLRFRPLPRRLNIIVTSHPLDVESGVESDVESSVTVTSLEAGLHLLDQPEFVDTVDRVFVIGGSQLYHAALQHPGCDRIYMTRILDPPFHCDTFFPEIDSTRYHEVACSDLQTENGIDFQFATLSQLSGWNLVTSGY